MRLLHSARRLGLAFLLIAIASLAGTGGLTPTAQAQVGGPVALAGIDAENGGVGGHGPIGNYTTFANAVYNAGVKGANVLVVGGGKSPTDGVTSFWNAIDAASSFSVTYVNGGPAIATAIFTPYRMVVVVSEDQETPDGGLTLAEDTAIDLRFNDIAAHVNAGGGVLGFSSANKPSPYGYIAGAAPVTATVVSQYPGIDPTPAGIAVGITNSLDVCCWHDIFTTWPSFLDVLAYRGGTPDPAALGGFEVVIPGFVLTPASATNPAGTPHTLTIAASTTVGSTTTPENGVVVTFTVTPSGGSTPTPAGGTCITGTTAPGECTFTYTSPTVGSDTITATGVVATQQRTATATKTWVQPQPATLTLAPKTATNEVDTNHTVTATVKDASGNPVPNITVRFTITGSVNTSGSCITAAVTGQCSFTYTGPPLPGADAISAYADTNNNTVQDPGEPGDTATKLWVPPVSTPCEAKITYGGRIKAANGDRATFGGNAKYIQGTVPQGSQEYQDHGPALPMNVKSINVLAITCTTNFKQASIFGDATIDGAGTYSYRIDVEDNAEPGRGADKYRIRISTYDSGSQTLEGGNIQSHKVN